MILHVDMNAYFATLEQQWNPSLRGKPIIICGKGSTERTVVATASYEAKRRGIKNGMAVWQALKIVPEAMLVAAQYQKYVATTKKIVAILESFTPDVEVYSIDEAFLKIENCELAIAHQIKKQIKQQIGELCTCSIGIAPNKLLAKIASEFKKPDGLTIVATTLERKSGASDLLKIINLDDIPGIGGRVLTRLNKLGTFTIQNLQNTEYSTLKAEFGEVYARFLYNACRGIDNSPLVRFRDAPAEKSFGHSYTLPKEIYTLPQAKAMLLHLAEKVGVRMRAKNFYGRVVHAWLRFNDFTGFSQQTTMAAPTNDGYEIFRAGEYLIQNSKIKNQKFKPIRAVGISCSGLSKTEQLTLFAPERKRSVIPKLLDVVSRRHGHGKLLRAATLPMQFVLKNIPDGRNGREFI